MKKLALVLVDAGNGGPSPSVENAGAIDEPVALLFKDAVVRSTNRYRPAGSFLNPCCADHFVLCLDRLS
jgi:hypothetical protein